ncbi:S8 family serine peptidase [Vibrio metschnikovii]
MRNFYQQGMLLVAAAGNSGNSGFSYPASYDAVVSVAAVNSSGNVANFSQFNSQVELSAPGVNVLSTGNNGGYLSYSGTSMASPHVAGVAALVWSHFPQCRPERIRQVTQSNGSRSWCRR